MERGSVIGQLENEADQSVDGCVCKTSTSTAARGAWTADEDVRAPAGRGWCVLRSGARLNAKATEWWTSEEDGSDRGNACGTVAFHPPHTTQLNTCAEATVWGHILGFPGRTGSVDTPETWKQIKQRKYS